MMKIVPNTRGSFDVVDPVGKVLINFPTREEAQLWIERHTPQPLLGVVAQISPALQLGS
jgi:hypothetical protein